MLRPPAAGPLELLVDRVDVGLLVQEDPGTVVPDELLQPEVRGLHLGRVEALAGLDDEPVDFGIVVEGALGRLRVEMVADQVVRLARGRRIAEQEGVVLRLLVLGDLADIGAPRGRLELHREPRFLQEARHRLAHLLVEEVAAHRHAEVEGGAGRPRLVQELLGARGIIAIRGQARVESEDAVRQRRPGDRGEPAHDALGQGLAVDGVVQGLAHALVRERRAIAAEADEHHAVGGRHHDAQARIGLEPGSWSGGTLFTSITSPASSEAIRVPFSGMKR